MSSWNLTDYVENEKGNQSPWRARLGEKAMEVANIITGIGAFNRSERNGDGSCSLSELMDYTEYQAREIGESGGKTISFASCEFQGDEPHPREYKDRIFSLFTQNGEYVCTLKVSIHWYGGWNSGGEMEDCEVLC